MSDIFDQLATTGAGPSAGSGTPPLPATATGSGGAANQTPAAPAGTAPQGDIFDQLAANPNLGQPPPVREPGSFGPYDESESHLFFGPFHKGLAEAQQDWGIKNPGDSATDVASDVWDSLVEGAKGAYKNVRSGLYAGTNANLNLASDEAAVLATPVAMMQSGLTGLLKMPGEATQGIIDALKNPGPDAEGVTGRQRLGRSVGHMINFLAQVATMEEAGEFGKAVATGKTADALDKAAAAPGNAMVRANRAENYMFGKNPGRVLVDEPIHPTLSLENVRAQVEAAGDRLHSQVNSLLRGADTVQRITPQGAVVRVPNPIDWASEVEDAAKEVKADVQKQSGVTNRAAVVKAINDIRDDILSEHDADGNVTGAKPRQAVPSQVNEIKKSVGGRGNYQVFTDAGEAEKAKVVDRFIKKVYGKLNDLADNATGGAPGERVRDLNRRYSNAIEFRNLIDRRIALENGTGGFNAMLRKGGWAAGIQQLLWGRPEVGAGLLANQALRSTMGRIVTAKALDLGARALRSPAGAAAATAAGAAAGTIPAIAGAAQRGLEGEQ